MYWYISNKIIVTKYSVNDESFFRVFPRTTSLPFNNRLCDRINISLYHCMRFRHNRWRDLGIKLPELQLQRIFTYPYCLRRRTERSKYLRNVPISHHPILSDDRSKVIVSAMTIKWQSSDDDTWLELWRCLYLRAIFLKFGTEVFEVADYEYEIRLREFAKL